MLPGVWTASSAQGFGKNKIQYSDFEWRVLESTHFDLYFYPEEDTLARTGLRIAEEAYRGIAARFGFEVSDRIPLIIYSSHNQFEETNVSPYFLPEGVGGFTEFLKGRVALPFNGSYADFERLRARHLARAGPRVPDRARLLRLPPALPQLVRLAPPLVHGRDGGGMVAAVGCDG